MESSGRILLFATTLALSYAFTRTARADPGSYIVYDVFLDSGIKPAGEAAVQVYNPFVVGRALNRRRDIETNLAVYEELTIEGDVYRFRFTPENLLPAGKPLILADVAFSEVPRLRPGHLCEATARRWRFVRTERQPVLDRTEAELCVATEGLGHCDGDDQHAANLAFIRHYSPCTRLFPEASMDKRKKVYVELPRVLLPEVRSLQIRMPPRRALVSGARASMRVLREFAPDPSVGFATP